MRRPHYLLALFCAASLALTAQAAPMFNASSFALLQFLEGRWQGVGPGGKAFFDEYRLVEPGLLRSMRHADASFSKVIDGSTVALQEGEIVSTWGQFRWKASSLVEGKACFEPVQAPSSFCWERVDADTVTVTQRWTGADDKPQSYVLKLSRIKP